MPISMAFVLIYKHPVRSHLEYNNSGHLTGNWI